ncbi:MAG: DUF1573 domain-containing protein [Planctomycetota bacterium]
MSSTNPYHRPLPLVVALFALSLTTAPGVTAQDSGPERVTGKPRIHMPVVSYYWDAILQGTTLRQEFIVENLGDQPLAIRNVTTKCHCSTFEYDPEIPAGGQGKLTLIFDSNKIKVGSTEKDATIHTNDPDTPEAKIWYGGAIKLAFNANPRSPVLRSVIGETTTTDVVLYPATDLTFDVADATSAFSLFTVKEMAKVAHGGTKIVLEKVAGTTAEKKPDYLKLTFTMSDGTTITPFIPVDVETLNYVTITPALNVSFLSRDTDALFEKRETRIERSIRVKSLNANRRFTITSTRLEGAPEGVFALETKTVTEGSHYEVILSVLTYPQITHVDARLIIETDDPALPRQELKVFAKFGRQ